MASSRNKLIALVALIAVGGAAAYVLTSGDGPVLKLSSSENVIKIEAAGVHYVNWPELSVRVNGEEIQSRAIENTQRQMIEFDVPEKVGPVKTIELKLVNDSDCRKEGFDLGASCTDRSIMVRGLYLNDEKLEGVEASGEGNLASLLRKSDGGITWKAAQ